MDLVPEGEDIPVTRANREQFVELYVRYILEESVRTQFDAFAAGFLQVAGGPALSLFQPRELELLVRGLPHLDFEVRPNVAPARDDFGLGESSAVKSRMATGNYSLHRERRLETILLEFFVPQALEKAAQYEGGYSPEHPTIKNFWKVGECCCCCRCCSSMICYVSARDLRPAAELRISCVDPQMQCMP